jgi:hypothetical protein
MTETPSHLGVVKPKAQNGSTDFNLTTFNVVKWKDKVLRVEFLGGTAEQREQVRKFALQWSQKTNVRFLFHTKYFSDIRIAFNNTGGSYSAVGNLAKLPQFRGKHTMNFQWIDQRTVMHEFGHALGFKHEHSRPDLDIYWNKPQVYQDMAEQGWNKAKVDLFIFKPLSLREMIISKKDPQSIMMYPIPEKWTLNGAQFPAIENLSPIDISFTNQIYKKPWDAYYACTNYGNEIRFNEFTKENSSSVVSWKHHCNPKANLKVVASKPGVGRIWQIHERGKNPERTIDEESWVQVSETFSLVSGIEIVLKPHGRKTIKEHGLKTLHNKYTEEHYITLRQGEANMFIKKTLLTGQPLSFVYAPIGQGKLYDHY